MLKCLQFAQKQQAESFWLLAVAVVIVAVAGPGPVRAGSDPLIIETPRQYVYLAAADSGNEDSTLIRQKPAMTESKSENLPGIDEFVVVKDMPQQLLIEKPAYPEQAKKAGIEGDVWIKALVDKEGKVAEAIIHKDAKTDAGFGKAALDAALKCEYKPAIGEDGKPVAVWVTYKVAFRLDEK